MNKPELLDVSIYVSIHYCEKLKHWIAYAFENEQSAIDHRGFGEFAGMGIVHCKIPKIVRASEDG